MWLIAHRAHGTLKILYESFPKSVSFFSRHIHNANSMVAQRALCPNLSTSRSVPCAHACVPVQSYILTPSLRLLLP